MRRLLLPLAGLLLALAAVGQTAGTSAQTPSAPEMFWGMDPQQVPLPDEFMRMRAGGVDSVRYPLFWSATEDRRGHYDWSDFDYLVRGAALAGVQVLPVILSTPDWLASDPRTLPVNSAKQGRAWQGFLRAAVKRYGPNGRFWVEHSVNPPPSVTPDPVPYTPIRIWQVLNEVNFFYFAKPISPAKYGAAVKLAHSALTGADRGAKIVLAGLFASPRQHPPQAMQGAAFLRKLYKVKGIRAAFDYVALHPYATDASELGPKISALRRVMKRHRDGNTGLWITEMGWGSGIDTAFEKGSEQGQADELDQAFTLLLAHRKAWHIARVYWFAWKDRLGTCNFCDSVGLFRVDNTPKLAWYRYVEFAGGTP